MKMKTKLKNLWWVIINKRCPIDYYIYSHSYDEFYLKITAYKQQGKELPLTIDLRNSRQIKNLKNNKDYLKIQKEFGRKIQEKFESLEDKQIVLNTIKEFNSIIDYIIKNFQKR